MAQIHGAGSWYGASNALDDTESLLELLPLVNQTGDLLITADATLIRDELIATGPATSVKKSRIANSS